MDYRENTQLEGQKRQSLSGSLKANIENKTVFGYGQSLYVNEQFFK